MSKQKLPQPTDKDANQPTDTNEKPQLSEEELAEVAAGRMFNPQPDPPG